MHLKKKAVVSAAAVTAALLSAVPLAAAAHADPRSASYATVIGSTSPCKIIASAANIRAKASTSSTILGIGYKGQGCIWYSRTIGGDGWYWYHIKMNTSKVTGWVRGDLLEHY
jgi:hypothetical protein